MPKPTINSTIEKIEALWSEYGDSDTPTVMDSRNDPALQLTTYGWKQARKIIKELLDSKKKS